MLALQPSGMAKSRFLTGKHTKALQGKELRHMNTLTCSTNRSSSEAFMFDLDVSILKITCDLVKHKFKQTQVAEPTN